nr:MAG TPA: hypothetical protein [Caudoviricetes sp.]
MANVSYFFILLSNIFIPCHRKETSWRNVRFTC